MAGLGGQDLVAVAVEEQQGAAAQGARIILLQELFETLYFCQEENPNHFGLATDIEKNVVHGSDAPETAAFEIGYFFNGLEIQNR